MVTAADHGCLLLLLLSFLFLLLLLQMQTDSWSTLILIAMLILIVFVNAEIEVIMISTSMLTEQTGQLSGFVKDVAKDGRYHSLCTSVRYVSSAPCFSHQLR